MSSRVNGMRSLPAEHRRDVLLSHRAVERRAVDLLLHVADLLHRVVSGAYTVSNADEEVELLLQVVLRGLDPRVLHDVEAAGLRPAPDGEPDLVAPRHGERAPRVPGPEHQALEAMRVALAPAPHAAMQSCR